MASSASRLREASASARSASCGATISNSALLTNGSTQATGRPRPPLNRTDARQLPRRYWLVVLLGAVFTLARFSEAFLVLRAQQLAVALAWVPLVMVAMNLVYAASAYPFGKLADTLSHGKLLAGGLLVLVVADVLLAAASHWGVLLLGVTLWGVHMGMTQGLLAAMVAEVAPADLRGTAFGVFNLASGVALLLASGLAGWLWDAIGAGATFAGGAAIAALALAALLLRPSGSIAPQ